jgi:hypothetical protein
LTKLGGVEGDAARLRTQRYVLLAAHAAVVGAFLLLCAAARPWEPTVDANIGGGLVMLVLQVAGLPWTLIVYPWTLLVVAFGGAAPPQPGVVAVDVVGALLNVFIHAAWVWRKNTRASQAAH